MRHARNVSFDDPEWRTGGSKQRRSAFRYKLKSLYGITEDDYAQMLVDQKMACAICRNPFERTPDVDHCHVTGRVRGLLCRACNRGIGWLESSPEISEAASAYLEDVV
jgi:hypothetical protein